MDCFCEASMTTYSRKYVNVAAASVKPTGTQGKVMATDTCVAFGSVLTNYMVSSSSSTSTIATTTTTTLKTQIILSFMRSRPGKAFGPSHEPVGQA